MAWSSRGEDAYVRLLSETSSSTSGSASNSLSETSSSTSGSASNSSSSAASQSSSHSSSGTHHHQHDALLFLFNGILIGVAIFHISAIFPSLQLSVALFVLGMILSLLLEGLKIKDHIGLWGYSYKMWMDIDPHLLLFTMLPMLLAGDAMTIDTSVAKRVGHQCLYMAGPGVLISALVTAGFLQLLLGWDFLLSLVTGSILCATDPVAVVALLKELGASPTLTVQIQGESLLNDGTAIVLYTVAYDMLSGEDYDIADMLMFLVRTAIMAVGLGIFLGYFFFSWIRLASNRFNHSSAVIQILLTLSAAYWSFVLAEGVLKMSGVLATVGCSLVLAHHMWPHIVEVEALVDFWHALENLGNIIIFVLGGALVGAAMVHIGAADYLNLLAIYAFLTILRGLFIFSSRPILKFLHKDKAAVAVEDALVMTWGGLRGAVGLALAIQVASGRAENATTGEKKLDEDTADRVLFFVAGVAFLTTVVNATTCPALVNYLGITALPEAEAKLLHKFNERLVSFSHNQKNPQEVTDELHHLLAEIEHDILSSRKREEKVKEGGREHNMQTNLQIVERYRQAVDDYKSLDSEHLHRLNYRPTDLNGDINKMIHILEKRPDPVDPELPKALNKVFLSMVSTNYRNEIDQGELRPGSDEAELLFTSVRFSALRPDLDDFKWLSKMVKKSMDRLASARMSLSKGPGMLRLNSAASHHLNDPGCVARTVASSRFNLAVSILICINVIYVAIEEIVRGEENKHDSVVWVVFEALFTFLFLVEFVLKFIALRLEYFKSSWNNFDFFLVIMGVLGLVLSIAAFDDSHSGAQASSESRVIRIARVLRTMRFLRFFRLFHARLSADKYISEELSECMREMSVFSNFCHAHLGAQEGFIRYFAGKLEDSNDLELSRCVLQSMTSVYLAIEKIIAVHNRMDTALVDELHHVQERKHIVEKLEEFVEHALKDGAISSKNAGSLLHPLHHELSECLVLINKRKDGVLTPLTPTKQHGHHKLQHAANKIMLVNKLAHHDEQEDGEEQQQKQPQQIIPDAFHETQKQQAPSDMRSQQAPSDISEGDCAAGNAIEQPLLGDTKIESKPLLSARGEFAIEGANIDKQRDPSDTSKDSTTVRKFRKRKIKKAGTGSSPPSSEPPAVTQRRTECDELFASD